MQIEGWHVVSGWEALDAGRGSTKKQSCLNLLFHRCRVASSSLQFLMLLLHLCPALRHRDRWRPKVIRDPCLHAAYS